MTNGFPTSARDVLRDTQKRLGRQERRPTSRLADEALPGISAVAVQVMDWNSVDTSTNGFYHSLPGAQNSPDVTLSWTGQTIARDDGTGMQQVWNTDGAFPRYWVRTYGPQVPTPATPITEAGVGTVTYENSPLAGAIGTGDLHDSSDATGVYAETVRDTGTEDIGTVVIDLPVSTITSPVLHLRAEVTSPDPVQDGFALEIRDGDGFIIHEDTIVPAALATTENFEVDLAVVPELLDGTKTLRFSRGTMEGETDTDGTYRVEVYEAWLTGESTQPIGTGTVLEYGPWQRFATQSGNVGETEIDPPVMDTINDAYDWAQQALNEIDPPTDPPAAVELKATGTLDSIILTTTPTDAPTTWLNYHMSTTSGFTPDATTLLPESPTRTTVMPVTSLPDGSPLEADTSYHFVVIPENVVDEGTPSAEVEAALDPTRASVETYAIIAAGDGVFGRISVGPGYWDPDKGIVIPQNDGSETIISTDPDQPSKWAGQVETGDLKVTGGQAEVDATATLEIQGIGKLLTGVSNPKTPPTVTDYWESVSLELTGDTVGDDLSGLCTDDNADYWVTTGKPTKDTPGGGQVKRYNILTGHYVDDLFTYSSSTLIQTITRVGAHYYVLTTPNPATRYDIRKYDMAGNSVATWTNVLDIDAVASSSAPALGPDFVDGHLVMAWPSGGGNLRIRRFNVSTGATVDTTNADAGTNFGLNGIMRGQFDWGVTRFVAARQSATGHAKIEVYTGAGATDSAKEWGRANGDRAFGFYWEEVMSFGYFHHLNGAGRIHRYEEEGPTLNLQFSYTWMSTNGLIESMASPAQAVTRKLRAGVTVSSPSPPEYGIAGTQKATSVVFYGSNDGGTTWEDQGFANAPPWSFDLTEYQEGGGAPPGANGFIGISAPGTFESEAANGSSVPHTRLKGNGEVRLAKKMQTGVVSSGALTADTNKDVAVTFPVAFDATPNVTLTVVNETNPSTIATPGARLVSTTGFTAVFRRSSTSTYDMVWTAIVPD